MLHAPIIHNRLGKPGSFTDPRSHLPDRLQPRHYKSILAWDHGVLDSAPREGESQARTAHGGAVEAAHSPSSSSFVALSARLALAAAGAEQDALGPVQTPGSRRSARHLENLGALDLTLDAIDMGVLDEVSSRALGTRNVSNDPKWISSGANDVSATIS
ncbi:hypothetical protein GCM10009700_35520 [Brevibacterium sanguinis]|uniref:hypothetical protein n=1 Tax=Brevibacterium sanguinis TaxID=232444 RepID=UPI0031CF94DA